LTYGESLGSKATAWRALPNPFNLSQRPLQILAGFEALDSPEKARHAVALLAVGVEAPLPTPFDRAEPCAFTRAALVAPQPVRDSPARARNLEFPVQVLYDGAPVVARACGEGRGGVLTILR
jgi:hypothetical protein